jgi:hypothetical protein
MTHEQKQETRNKRVAELSEREKERGVIFFKKVFDKPRKQACYLHEANSMECASM